jgi:hypothetical protein
MALVEMAAFGFWSELDSPVEPFFSRYTRLKPPVVSPCMAMICWRINGDIGIVSTRFFDSDTLLDGSFE